MSREGSNFISIFYLNSKMTPRLENFAKRVNSILGFFSQYSISPKEHDAIKK
jgi:hypothetical protein